MRLIANRALAARPAATLFHPVARTSTCLNTSTRFFTSTTTARSDASAAATAASEISRNETITNATTQPPSGHIVPRFAPGKSNSMNYSVYASSRSAGQSKFTLIKHVEGDKKAFIDFLGEKLGLPRDQFKLSPVTGHIEIKGTHVEQVKEILVQQFGK